ncbi:MAG: hypothetical protein ABIZ91_09010 [Gemmatimonadaceae bacterium]
MTHRLRSVQSVLPLLALIAAGSISMPASAAAQWSTAYEQFYLPGSFNWKFRHNFPAADRLFNAFDYGHAILYEKLWTMSERDALGELENRQYDFITRELLVHPPKVALEEAAIEVAYAKMAPEAKAMFDWAHLLHRQIYDVWADESMSNAQRDAKVQQLLTYYKTRRDLAFSSKPKTMELMEGQSYSTAFRDNYPKFNGLIWAYHWLQVGLYEPLMVAKNPDEKQSGVFATITRFKQMLTDAPASMPYLMPMTAAIAPEFSKRYPEAAIIFDNLHSMHDVVSDILANPDVPRDRKRAEILLAARRYRDDTSYVQSTSEWLEMTAMMGVENMGGPAVNFLPDLPTPTVARGAVMAGMDHADMPGMRTPAAAGAGHDMSRGAPGKDSAALGAKDEHAGMKHGAPADSSAQRADSAAGMEHGKMPGMEHAKMPGMEHGKMPGMEHGMEHDKMEGMKDHAALHVVMQLLQDPGIRTRVMANSALRQMMLDLKDQLPPEPRAHLEEILRKAPPVAPAKKPAPKRGAAKPKAAPKRMPGHSMPGMDHGHTPPAKKVP